MAGLILGIESTAHTFSFGVVTAEGELHPSSSSLFRPKPGEFIHARQPITILKKLRELLQKINLKSNFDWNSVVAIAFSQGPGLGPCLRVGASVARTLSTMLEVPLIGVNHCVAHIEVGRNQTGCDDPVLLYVSGGNTKSLPELMVNR